jgi:hypothetical protein
MSSGSFSEEKVVPVPAKALPTWRIAIFLTEHPPQHATRHAKHRMWMTFNLVKKFISTFARWNDRAGWGNCRENWEKSFTLSFPSNVPMTKKHRRSDKHFGGV